MLNSSKSVRNRAIIIKAILNLPLLGQYKYLKMECFSCLLRYNQQQRSPLIVSCGHSLCSECVPKFTTCPICAEPISSVPKPNYSLLEMISKDTKPIDKFIKVCFVGSSAVGKTSLIRQFMGQQFTEEVATTIGYDFTFRDSVLGDYCVRFQLWDSAGQERYRAISPIHYKNSHVVVIVYNVSADAKDNRLTEWIQESEKNAPQEALKIVVGNKLDLIEGKICKPLDDDAWNIIKEKKIQCFETSCKSGSGIEPFWLAIQDYFFHRKDYEPEKSNLQDSVRASSLGVRQSKDVASSTSYPTKIAGKGSKKIKRVEQKKQQCC